MFELFNKPALDDAILSGKTFKFSQNAIDFPDTLLEQEWEYIKIKCGLSNDDISYMIIK